MNWKVQMTVGSKRPADKKALNKTNNGERKAKI